MFNAMGRGFHVTFDNGITVSVQFGGGNYCDNRNLSSFKDKGGPCKNAEVALFRGPTWIKGWPHENPNDDVQGYLSPAQVLEIMVCAEKQ